MKEKQPFKRFDLFSVLAILSVLAALLFESIFIFELYRVDYARIELCLPAFIRPSVERWASSFDLEMEAEVAKPVPDEEVPVVVDLPEKVLEVEMPEAPVPVEESNGVSSVVIEEVEVPSSVVIEERAPASPDEVEVILSIPAKKKEAETGDEDEPVPVG